jgi:hypothetical protein
LLLAHYTQRSTCLASSICDDCVNLFNICFIIIPRSPKKTASSPASTVCRGHHTTLTSRPCRLAYGRRRVPKTGLLTASHHPSHTTPMILLQHTQRDWLKSPKSLETNIAAPNLDHKRAAAFWNPAQLARCKAEWRKDRRGAAMPRVLGSSSQVMTDLVVRWLTVTSGSIGERR